MSHDPRRRSRRRILVRGRRGDLPAIVAQRDVREVLRDIPNASSPMKRALVAALSQLKVRIATLPGTRDEIDTKPAAGDTRPIRKLIDGRRVLVTGAAGSIGSELSWQILALAPAQLFLLDRYENGLNTVMSHLPSRTGGCLVEALIGDVTNTSRVDAIISSRRPEIVFHAAAHNDVPLMERHPCEAVTNNVAGARILAEAAELYGVDRFIFVSTDKAVRPASVMGATKRVGELIMLGMARDSRTLFLTVRLGDVLGSHGTVVSRLIDQINAGEPLTLGPSEVQRSFLLLPEAAELLLHATADAPGAGIYVLEMDAPIQLLELTRSLMRLMGRVPASEIPITFVGLRPGEKLFEELVWPHERLRPSPVPRVMRVESSEVPDREQVMFQVRELELRARCQDDAGVREFLLSMIPFCNPNETSEAPVTATVPRPAAPAAVGEELAAGQRCPACASLRLHRSLARSRWERVRKLFTHQRLFRCHHCGWRGWTDVMELAGEFPKTTEKDFALPDLERDPVSPPDDASDIRVTDKVMN